MKLPLFLQTTATKLEGQLRARISIRISFTMQFDVEPFEGPVWHPLSVVSMELLALLIDVKGRTKLRHAVICPQPYRITQFQSN